MTKFLLFPQVVAFYKFIDYYVLSVQPYSSDLVKYATISKNNHLNTSTFLSSSMGRHLIETWHLS